MGTCVKSNRDTRGSSLGGTLRFTIKASGDVFQFFGHIFAQPEKLATALGTGRVAGGQIDLFTQNTIRDRLSFGLSQGDERASAAWRSAQRWRARLSSRPAAPSWMSWTKTRSDGRAGLPTCATAFRSEPLEPLFWPAKVWLYARKCARPKPQVPQGPCACP